MTLYYSEDEVVVTVSGLTRARLTTYVEAEIVVPEHGPQGPVYREVDVARLQLLSELTEHFDLSEDGLVVVMRLVDQMHGLRSDLHCVLRAIAQEPEDVRARLAKALRSARA